ncbi:MAG: hypothetical protein ABJL54_07595 [Halioglobus sp.]
MLINLLTILFLGGTPSGMLVELSNIQDNIEIVVVKNERGKAALDVISRMEQRTKAQNLQVDSTAKLLDEALSVHDFSTAETDNLWNKYHAIRRNHHLYMIELRFELKEHITREEWQEIFGDG